MISNIPESLKEGRDERKEDDLKIIREKIDEISPGTTLQKEVFNPIRLGKYEAGKPARPIKVTCRTEKAKQFIIINASKIRQTTSDNRKKIWINSDQTRKERQAGKELRDQLKRRIAAGEVDLIIRGGKILKKTIRPDEETRGQKEQRPTTSTQADTGNQTGPSTAEGSESSE